MAIGGGVIATGGGVIATGGGVTATGGGVIETGGGVIATGGGVIATGGGVTATGGGVTPPGGAGAGPIGGGGSVGDTAPGPPGFAESPVGPAQPEGPPLAELPADLAGAPAPWEPRTGLIATALGAAPRASAAAVGGALAFEPRWARPASLLEPPNGSPLKATKTAIQRKTTRAPAVSAAVAPAPTR